MQRLLKADNLAFAYGDHPVLRDVSVTLAAGEVAGLLGPNGSGKSTLIRCLLGQLEGSGVVEWEAQPLRSWRRRDLARHVAYLPQSPVYEPDLTVLDVLRLGRAPYWGAFGLEAKRDVEVVEEVAKLLELRAVLSRRMDELSGGQRQRVFVGRCLVQEPKAMLLDEPATHLDLRHQVELLQLLRRLASERSVGVLLASHDLNVAASLTDRLILLDQGAVATEGAADRVLDPDLLARVYGLPMQRLDRGPGQPPVVLPKV